MSNSRGVISAVPRARETWEGRGEVIPSRRAMVITGVIFSSWWSETAAMLQETASASLRLSSRWW